MKAQRIVFVILFLMAVSGLRAQSYYSVTGSGHIAAGGTGVASPDLWSANNNQAAMAFYGASFGAGFYYQNSFMLKETSLNNGALMYSTPSGTFGLTINAFGYSNFNTKKIGLGYAKKLASRFSAGVQLDYINIFVGGNYGSRNLFTFELGLYAEATENISIGAHVFNPVRVKVADYNDERLPLVFNLGMLWKASKNFSLTAEAESDIDNKTIFKAGLEYKIIDMLYARLGVSNNPNIFSFGAGLHLGNFRLDFSSTMHQMLGYSPQVSVVYEFDK
jgi:hypothetical protein